METLRIFRSEGTALLIVEQSMRRAISLADRIYLMRSGRIVADGPAKDFEARTDNIAPIHFQTKGGAAAYGGGAGSVILFGVSAVRHAAALGFAGWVKAEMPWCHAGHLSL